MKEVILHRGSGGRRRRSAWISSTALSLVLLTAGACRQVNSDTEKAPVGSQPARVSPAESKPADTYEDRRAQMVERQLRTRDIVDPSVLEVMGKVPRQLFVPEIFRDSAYGDWPLPIGYDQTISQPYIVALMTQAAKPAKEKKALDVGTGSGYQAAVLAELVKEVYSIEILCSLARSAEKRLTNLGYRNVQVRCGDGYQGWPEEAPFDIIIVAAAPDHVPEPLIDQLAPGGCMVIPVGRHYQEMVVIEKDAEGKVQQKNILPVRFVPMTGEAQQKKR